MQEVKLASAPFLLVRTPSLHIQTSSMTKVFEANLKTETELWHLVVKEMWAGRKMADQHKVLLEMFAENQLLKNNLVALKSNEEKRQKKSFVGDHYTNYKVNDSII